MNFSNYLGLLFLLWLPLLTALYFFQAKPKKLRISSHFLWQAAIEKRKKNSILETFQNSILYWLQLIFFFFLFIALSDPYTEKENISKKALIIIENSGSMAANDYYHSRLQEAKSLAHRWLQKQDVSGADIIAWSEVLLKMPDSLLPFTAIEEIPQTHLRRGDFNSIFEMLLNCKNENIPVFIAASSLNEGERKALNYIGIDFFLLSEKNDNVFFCGVELKNNENEKNQALVQVCHTGNPGSVNLQVSNEEKRIQNISFQFKESKVQNISIDIPPSSQQIKFELSARNDLIKEDNLWLLESENIEEDIALNSFQNGITLHDNLKLFFASTARITENQNDATMRLEFIPPEKISQRPFTISLISNNYSSQTFHRSFLFNNSSPIVKYMQGNNFRPARWDLQIPDFVPIIMAVDQKLELFTPVLSQHKSEPTHFLFNLEQHSSLMNNIELSILLENIRRFWQKQGREKSKAEMGETLKGAKPGTIAQSNIDVLLYYPDIFVICDSYETGNGKKLFCPFPASESHLQAVPELSDRTEKLNMTSKNTSIRQEKESHAFWFGFCAIIFTLIEWFIFCRQL